MAATVSEVFVSRSVLLNNGKPTMDRNYIIRGVNTEQAALNALINSSLCPDSLPLTFGGNEFIVPRQRIEIREECSARREGDASPAKDHLWNASARYSVEGTGSSITWVDPPETRWSFTFTTESFIQKTAFETKRFGNNGPDCGGSINVVNRSGENIVEGASIMIPRGVLRAEKTFSADEWNARVGSARSAMCKMNSDSFSAGDISFGAGELLMVGAEARQNSTGKVDVTYEFLYSPGSAGTIDDIGYEKGGWDYLWVYHEKTMDSDAGLAMPKAASVYVNQVYDYASFGDLGL